MHAMSCMRVPENTDVKSEKTFHRAWCKRVHTCTRHKSVNGSFGCSTATETAHVTGFVAFF